MSCFLPLHTTHNGWYATAKLSVSQNIMIILWALASCWSDMLSYAVAVKILDTLTQTGTVCILWLSLRENIRLLLNLCYFLFLLFLQVNLYCIYVPAKLLKCTFSDGNYASLRAITMQRNCLKSCLSFIHILNLWFVWEDKGKTKYLILKSDKTHLLLSYWSMCSFDQISNN